MSKWPPQRYNCKYNFQLEFIFKKKKEPLRVGKIYTPEEIDENYGTEIVDSFTMTIDTFKELQVAIESNKGNPEALLMLTGLAEASNSIGELNTSAVDVLGSIDPKLRNIFGGVQDVTEKYNGLHLVVDGTADKLVVVAERVDTVVDSFNNIIAPDFSNSLQREKSLMIENNEQQARIILLLEQGNELTEDNKDLAKHVSNA